MPSPESLKGIAVSFAGFVTLAFGLLISVPIYAQVVGATLSGTVTDQSGAVIPNAQISIKNVATGVTGAVTSDAAGFYTAPNLLPGPYQVTVSAAGFRTELRSGITLAVGAQEVVNLTMQVGRVTEQVEVASEAPTVQLATSTISADVNSTTVRELPLNGRSWTDLATLQPGVNSTVGSQLDFANSGRGVRGFGNQMSISGGLPTQNNYRLDGLSINTYDNSGPGSALGGNLGVDAIAEFSVLTSNYSSEYGKTSGGVVNAVTKSGTNEFHGDVYEFLRNNALDGNNFFLNAAGIENPPFRRNQFGGAAGGPIRKDRTFIFGDYEGIRQAKGLALSPTVPSDAARAGQLCSLCAVKPPVINVSPAVAQYLQLYPHADPNTLSANGDTGIYTFAGQQAVNENFFTTRVDHKISEKDGLFGTYMYDDGGFTSPDTMDNALYGSHTNRQVIVLEESHVFSPTLVNTVRLGYNREGAADAVGIQALNQPVKDLSLGSRPGYPAPIVMVAGLSTDDGGLGTNTIVYPNWNSFQAYDDAFLTHGTQSVKFGFAVERMQYNFLVVPMPGGQWNFGSLSDFLQNIPLRFTAPVSNAQSPKGLRQTLFGGYLQDDWRFRPNLTINLGLRYEMTTVPNEVQGKIVTMLHMTDGPNQIHLGSPYFSNPTLRNFEPRAGFSWDPSHNGRTAVRGGFGFYDVLPLPGYFFLTLQRPYPLLLLGSSGEAPGSFGGYAAWEGLTPNKTSESIVEQHPHRNYVMQWNFNVQREITPNLTATVGYVGSHGVHMLLRDDDADMVIPTRTSAGWLWPTPASNPAFCNIPSGTGFICPRINENWGSIRNIFWSGDSTYDALELSIEKRMSHGIQVQGSYTWGKALDNSSATIAPDEFTNSVSSWYWFDPKISKGPADFDIRQILVINGIWQVPAPRSGLAAQVLGGWELGGIFKASNGIPMTPIIGGDPLGQNSSDTFGLPDRVAGCNVINGNFKSQNLQYLNPNCFTLPTPSNLLGDGGRNYVYGPPLVNLDFSVYKNTYIKRISENFNAQFRAELFNSLNHPSFQTPFGNNDVTSGSFGRITSTVTDPREIQLALKLIW